MTEPMTVDRRTGVAAVIAGVLMFASVAAEFVWSVQTRDGSVTNTAGFALLVLAWTVGAAALTVAILGLRAAVRSRAGAIGRWMSTAGAALLTAFGVVGLITALTTGAPSVVAFLLFGVGFLLLGIGCVPLALGLRRSGALDGWWVAVLIAGASGLAAVTISADPWHDLALFTFDAAWFALGLRLLVPARTSVPA